jgi:hypothetical protein
MNDKTTQEAVIKAHRMLVGKPYRGTSRHKVTAILKWILEKHCQERGREVHMDQIQLAQNIIRNHLNPQKQDGISGTAKQVSACQQCMPYS